MEISEVRVRLIPNRNSGDRLRAFCSVTFDGDFVIRDLKVIDGVNGIFVAMPSRKLADRCPRCRGKNHLRARYCNECGAKLNRERIRRDSEGRPKFHADVAHPINSACRERIEKAVREAYELELQRAKSPDYKPAAVDDDEFTDSDYDDLIADLKREAAQRRTGRTQESSHPAEGRPSSESHPKSAREQQEERPVPAAAAPVRPQPPGGRDDRSRAESRPATPASQPAEGSDADEFGTGIFDGD